MDDQGKNQAIDSILTNMDDKLAEERQKTQSKLDEIDRLYQEKVARRKAQEAARLQGRQRLSKSKRAFRERVRDDGWLKSIGLASSAGFTLLATIGACLWFGYQVDEALGSSPIAMVWGGILGGFGGVYLMYKEISR